MFTDSGGAVDTSEPWWRRKRPRRPPPPPEADAEAVKAVALDLMAALPVLPRLVVFDLDHTLWPFQCDRLRKDEMPYLYPQARGILNALKDKKVEMAIASRALRRGVAKTFLEKLGIRFMFGAQFFGKNVTFGPSTSLSSLHRPYTATGTAAYASNMEIFYTWSPKSEHFQSIRRKTGVPFKSMLFFDDEVRNVIATRKLGVCCVRVENGITLKKLTTGLSNYAKTSATPDTQPTKSSVDSLIDV